MSIEINLDTVEKSKLIKVIADLYKSNSIDSESIEDFIKLTITIILNENDKNKESLIRFYKEYRDLCKKINNK